MKDVNLTFDDLETGTIVDDEYFADNGVTVFSIVNGQVNPADNPAMVFDTSNPTGGDHDLETDNLGNVLIISEDGDQHDPDDNAHGGVLCFEFAEPVTMNEITLLDVEETAYIKLWDEHGNLIAQFEACTDDNGQVVVDLCQTEGVARMDIVLKGSGAVDNIKYTMPGDDLDGIVEGSAEGDLIDLAYDGDPDGDMIDAGDAVLGNVGSDDDIVVAGDGDDTVEAMEGNDTVYGGADDDDIDGGAGDDVLFGDSEGPLDAERESFNWAGADDNDIDNGFSQDTGSVTVTYDRIEDTGSHASSTRDDQLNVDGIDSGDETIATSGGLYSETGSESGAGAFQWTFSEEVTNVEFNVNDIDGDGVVKITAFDADGNQIEVDLTGGSDITLLDTDSVAGADTADSNGDYDTPSSPDYTLQVSIEGPVAKIVLEHDQDGPNNSGIHVTDIFFDAPFGGGTPGNDTIDGGEGDDELYGEDGEDELIGGEGADLISGGDDADTIIGGTGGDTIDGGAGGNDDDTLDLTGVGNFELVDVTPDSDGNGFDGTVNLLDDDLNVVESFDFTNIETILGTPVDRAPEAGDDTAEVDEDETVVIDVLANDSDPEGDDLTVTEATAPNGEVTINPDGTLTYEPNEDFNGTDTITYTVSDPAGNTDTATVTVTVNPVNDAPVAEDDTAEVDEDGSVDIPVLDNDTDVDGDTLTVTEATAPNGEVTINPDGTLTYEPDENFNGTDTITYTIDDGNGGTDTATVTVTVNPADDAPVAVDDPVETDEDTPVTFDPTANDSDPDGDPVTVADFTQPANGEVTQNPDGTLTYTPDEDFNGTDTFEVTVTDPDGNEDTSTVTVTVNPVNDAPDAVNDVAETPEETTIVLTPLDNDSDPDGDPLIITSASVPAAQGTVTFTDDTITFEPAEDYTGPATISYGISDGNGGTDVAEIVVDVTPVNDAPEAVDDLYETPEDTAITFDPTENDEDPDGDELTVVDAELTDPTQGEVTVNPDGTVTFTPADDLTGPVEITYTVEDPDGAQDEGTAIVNVGEEPDAPTANDDSATTPEDTEIVLSPLDNDTDPDGDTLTITSASVPADQGTVTFDDTTITFSPAEDFTGEATITYAITDGNGGTDVAEIVVDVTPVNDAPEANDDIINTPEDTPITFDPAANDFDPDGDDLTVVDAELTDPTQGEVTVNPDGTVTFTPADDFTGPVEITYTVEDPDGAQDTGTATVNVGAENDAPDAVDDEAETDQGTPVTILPLENDSDPDGDDIRVISAAEVPPAQGTVEFTDDTITFTPADDFVGEAEITYTISDGGGLTDTALITVTVNDVPEAPIAEDDTLETDEDEAVTFDPTANDSDPDGDPVTVADFTQPANGEVTQNPDGTLTYTPDEDFNGTDTFEVTVTDPDGNEDTSTVTVTVNPVNDAPVAEDDTDTTDFETPVVIDVLGNDVDPDGDPLTVTEATSPDGEVTINPDGTLTFTPEMGFSGPATITYTVEDPDGASDTATVTVTVGDGPMLDGIVEGTDEGDLIDLDYDGDPEGDMVDAGDAIFGDVGSDDDIIVAGGGDDTVLAEDGDDTVFAGPGDDSVEGGEGDDSLIGGGGSDTLLGEEGDDTLEGGIEGDLLDGGDGDDVIDGITGPDTIFGGDGDDSILAGVDAISDYAGDQPAFPDGDPNPDNGRDLVDGGAGDDTIRTGDDSDTITGGTGDDSINSGIDDDLVDGGEGDDSIIGSHGSDTIDGGDGDDTIFGGFGPEPIPGFEGEEDDATDPVPENGLDLIDGGAGNDLIFGEDDDDTLLGGEGDDTLDGGIDDDVLDGGDGNDSLLGGEGDDTIDGGGGTDTIDGEEGDDVITGGDRIDFIDGGEGDDSIDGNDGADFIDGGDGDDTIDGGRGNDSIDGGDGDDLIDGDTGPDTISGGDGDDTILSGSGSGDLLDGGADADLFQDLDAGDTVLGGSEGDDNDVLDLIGSLPTDGSYTLEDVTPDSDGNGIDGTVVYFDSNGDETGRLEFENIEQIIPCFTPGARIATPKGERLVEELREGDKIITRDNGIQEIRWVGRKDLSFQDLNSAPHMRPVLIKKGALGHNLPERDMVVSPNHRMLVASEKTALLFDEREVLVAAKHLVDNQGVKSVETLGTSYIHFMFDHHEVVLADGAWTESFQPGDHSLGGIGNAQRAEIFELFPELETHEGIDGYTSARRTLKSYEAMLLIE